MVNKKHKLNEAKRSYDTDKTVGTFIDNTIDNDTYTSSFFPLYGFFTTILNHSYEHCKKGD